MPLEGEARSPFSCFEYSHAQETLGRRKARAPTSHSSSRGSRAPDWKIMNVSLPYLLWHGVPYFISVAATCHRVVLGADSGAFEHTKTI